MDNEIGNKQPARRQAQHPAAGLGMRIFGLVMQASGCLLILVGASRLRVTGVVLSSPYRGQPAWQTLLITVGTICAGGAALYAGRRLSRHGRRHITRVFHSPLKLGPEPFVLFLRPFAEDRKTFQAGTAFVGRSSALSMFMGLGLENPSSRTVEEWISRTFQRFAKLLAVGQPGEKLPLPGADKLYLPLDAWQPVVSELIRRARLVVLVATPGPGTLWEFTEAVRLLPPARLVLLVLAEAAPPNGSSTYDRFRQAVPEAFATRDPRLQPPRLPDCPPLQHPDRLTWEPAVRGIVHFDAAWTPEFLRLDPTALRALTHLGKVRKLARTQLEPLLVRLQRTLP
ncbi:hypothetical protein ACIBLA_23425 [Streptomyces sp. NPDC050433]|uniref:hypothetical protein n=1 Tax=Streptomyces sp. NPDC050433 TaxID=3365615 RepID=UPI0037A512AD